MKKVRKGDIVEFPCLKCGEQFTLALGNYRYKCPKCGTIRIRNRYFY